VSAGSTLAQIAYSVLMSLLVYFDFSYAAFSTGVVGTTGDFME
jgi:hypothetical protein